MLNQPLKTIVNKENLSIQSNSTLKEAIDCINLNQKGVVVVLENETPVGIITERDIVEFLHKDADLNETAGKIAKKELVSTKCDRTIGHALNLTIENNIRRIIVTDDSDRFLGVITQQDLLKPLEDDFYRSTLKIRHILEKSRHLFHAHPDDTLSKAIRKMVENKISAVPVIEDGKAIGIITEKDIIKIAGDNISLTDVVNQHMSTPVTKVTLDTDLTDAVELMNELNIRRLIITDTKGVPTNIITIRDVLKNLEVDYSTFLERKLKHSKDIFNLLPEMLLEVTDNGHEQLIVWANDKVVKVFGSNILDRSITELIPKESWHTIHQTLLKINKIEGIQYNQDNKTYELSGFFVRTEGEYELGRYQIIVRDITEEVKLATTDPLTDLYNRRFTNEFLTKEIERSKRSSTRFTVIMSDIDDFKSVNDSYGHTAGDIVLKFMADLISSKLRNSDVLGRYGGDEFVFIMPDTDKETASTVIDRLRHLISTTEVPLMNGKEVKITISFGIAEFPRDGNSPDELFIKSDERLYEAKSAGKNRVVYK